MIIPYNSISIRLLNLCQGYLGHCVVITVQDGGMQRLQVGSFKLGIIVFLLSSVFLLLLIVLSQLLHDKSCVFFICLYCLYSLYLGITSAWKMLCLSCQIISNVSFQIIGLWISFTNEECFDLNHSLRNLLYFIHQNQRNRSGLSFQLADLLSLFIFVPCFNVGNSFEARTPRNNTEKDKKLTTDFVMDGTF